MRPERRRTLLALAGFTALTLAVFRPTPSELAHTVPAFHGVATDALLLVWATSWVSHALGTDPVHLFDAPIFHPAPDTLAYGDHMIGQALAGLPVWITSGNPLLEFNLLALASYALGATAMFACARAVTGSTVGAVVAGLAFAFTPFRFHSPLWLQLLCTAFMPIAFAAWLRFVRERRGRDWALWVGAWVAHALMGLYLALYFSVTMGALALLALVAAPTRRRARLWAGTLAAPLAVGTLLAPVLLPYLGLRAEGHVRHLALDTPWSFFLPGPGTLSGWLTGLAAPARFGPGLVVDALALTGLAAGWTRTRAGGARARFAWWATVTGLATTLALVLVPVDVQLALPGLDMVRNTNRAFFVSLLFVALLAADGAAWVVARCRHRNAAAIVLVALVLADLGTPPRERKRLPVGAEVPPVYAWLRRLPADAVVVDGPFDADGAARPMYLQTTHWRPTPTGYSGYVSPAGLWVNLRLTHFPHPELLRALAALGVDYVVWHLGTPARTEAFLARGRIPGLEPVARFGTDLLLRVTGSPQAPPAPGAVAYPAKDWSVVEAPSPAPPLAPLVDGDPATVWSYAMTPGAPVPRLVVDLGRPRPVSGVRVTPGALDAPGTYLATIELSDDGVAWTPVDAWLVPPDMAAFARAPQDTTAFVARFPTRRARYVRLSNPELAFWGGPWEMGGLDMLGDCAIEPIPGCEGDRGGVP